MAEKLFELAAAVGKTLAENGRMLACAESCTGGWIATEITAVPGSSAWFDCGFVTYSNRSKQDTLGVSEAVLAREGAVSAAVVEAMVAGAVDRSAADVAVAVSGIAGPGGATLDKPVGTVWIAWRVADRVDSGVHHFDGDRSSVRRQAVAAALRGLLQRLAA